MQHPEDDQTLDIISYIEEKPAHGQTVGYIRVSTTDQNTIRQLDGVELNKTFVDKISGSTGIKDRPELKKLFEYVRAGDTVVIHSFDRLARDLNILISLIQQLNDKGVALKSIKEDITSMVLIMLWINLSYIYLEPWPNFKSLLLLKQDKKASINAKNSVCMKVENLHYLKNNKKLLEHV